MLIDAPLLWEQVRLGEDSGLELKEARFHGNRVSAPHRDGLADGFTAFANSGGGRVVLGVTDDRKPQSLTPAQLDLLADRVTEICSDSITPPLDFSVYRVPVEPRGAWRCPARRDTAWRNRSPLAGRLLPAPRR